MVLQSKGARVAAKVVMVIGATALSMAFFGIALPALGLALKILPGLGLAGIVYFIGGAVLGCLAGAISTAVSLARTPALVTPFYVRFSSAMLAGNMCVAILAWVKPDFFAHV